MGGMGVWGNLADIQMNTYVVSGLKPMYLYLISGEDITPHNKPPPDDLQSDGLSEYEEESDNSLPDISDPTYGEKNKKYSPRKKIFPLAKKTKLLKKKNPANPSKPSDGALMKAARQNLLHKQKMFAINDKDKRLSKPGQEAEKSPLISSEVHEKTYSSHSYKPTKIAQLKPNAKSPKDVERGHKNSPEAVNSFRGTVDMSKQMARDKLRPMLLKHLQSPPREIETERSPELFSPREKSQEVILPKEKSQEVIIPKEKSQEVIIPREAPIPAVIMPFNQGESSQDDRHDGSDSDETIIFGEDVGEQNSEDISEETSETNLGREKRKNSEELRACKKFKGQENASRICVVGSPVHCADLDADAIVMEDNPPILIANIQGGVADAFEDPQKKNSLDILELQKKLKLKSACDTKLKEENERFDKELKREREMFDKRMAEIKAKHDEKVSIIDQEKQKLEAEVAEMVQLESVNKTSKAANDNGGSSAGKEVTAAREPSMPTLGKYLDEKL